MKADRIFLGFSNLFEEIRILLISQKLRKDISFKLEGVELRTSLNLLAIILLMIGLIVGTGLGSLIFPKSVTQMKTVTEIKSTTLTEVSHFTKTEVKTNFITSTATESVFITITKRIYPSETGIVLVSDSGNKCKNTRRFSLNETSDLKIIITAKPAPFYGGVIYLTWKLNDVETGKDLRSVSIRQAAKQEVETFEFYVSNIPPGNYYIRVTTGCQWTIKVEKLPVK